MGRRLNMKDIENIRVTCPKCGQINIENDIPVYCKKCKLDSLLQLDERYLLELVARSRVDNIKFSDFLPWCSNMGCNPEVGIVRNEIIESELGLSDLSIIYSGFYPQIGGTLRSATFKEYEALSVLNWANLYHASKVLCISSAGNAGRAFFQVAVQKKIPIIVIVPEFALQDFIMPESIIKL